MFFHAWSEQMGINRGAAACATFSRGPKMAQVTEIPCTLRFSPKFWCCSITAASYTIPYQTVRCYLYAAESHLFEVTSQVYSQNRVQRAWTQPPTTCGWQNPGVLCGFLPSNLEKPKDVLHFWMGEKNFDRDITNGNFPDSEVRLVEGRVVVASRPPSIRWWEWGERDVRDARMEEPPPSESSDHQGQLHCAG